MAYFMTAHALRDAIFIPDKEDKDRIGAFAASLDPTDLGNIFVLSCLIPVEVLQMGYSPT
jgi:hypothetical protein